MFTNPFLEESTNIKALLCVEQFCMAVEITERDENTKFFL